MQAIAAIDRFQCHTTLAPLRDETEPLTEEQAQASLDFRVVSTARCSLAWLWCCTQVERLEDMVWSDPEDSDSGRTPNEARAAGIIFGSDVTREFLAEIGVSRWCRNPVPPL